MSSNASGTFMMDPQEVERSGERFKDLSEEYKQCMNKLNATVEDLGTCWKSEDYNQFKSIFEQNAETIKQMSEAFASFGNILSTTGSNAASESAELRSTFH